MNAIQNNPGILVFEGCIKPNRPKRHFLEEAPINETGGYFWTCNVMIQRDYFLNVLHGFDEDFFMYGEDVDIRERIKQTDQLIVFIKEAFCIHPWRIPKDPLNFEKQKCMSRIILYSKHPHLKQKESFHIKIKNELRFYVKNVLFNVIRYRGRGVIQYIQNHIISNKLIRQNKFEYENNETGWSRFY
jgi:GT2 family glycosyltransferase